MLFQSSVEIVGTAHVVSGVVGDLPAEVNDVQRSGLLPFNFPLTIALHLAIVRCAMGAPVLLRSLWPNVSWIMLPTAMPLEIASAHLHPAFIATNLLLQTDLVVGLWCSITLVHWHHSSQHFKPDRSWSG